MVEVTSLEVQSIAVVKSLGVTEPKCESNNEVPYREGPNDQHGPSHPG